MKKKILSGTIVIVFIIAVLIYNGRRGSELHLVGDDSVTAGSSQSSTGSGQSTSIPGQETSVSDQDSSASIEGTSTKAQDSSSAAQNSQASGQEDSMAAASTSASSSSATSSAPSNTDSSAPSENPKEREMVKGRGLKKGDTIAVIAPAGWSDNDYASTVKAIRALGYHVVMGKTTTTQTGFFAGEPELRAKELNSFFADDDVDAILCFRGGYGSVEILGLLDYEMIAQHPKMLIGFSDVTALHVALQQNAGLVTIHGPTLSMLNPPDENGVIEDDYASYEQGSFYVNLDGTIDLPDGTRVRIQVPESRDGADNIIITSEKASDKEYSDLELPEGAKLRMFIPAKSRDTVKRNLYYDSYTWEQFCTGLQAKEPIGKLSCPKGIEITGLHPGTAEGRITGGNLTVLASLVGTPYELDGTGQLIILEDINEDASRIDRTLGQLYNSGLFDRAAGVIFGEFTNCRDGQMTVNQVLARYADMIDIPVIANVPVGHDRYNAFVPLGVHASITAGKGGKGTITIDEAYVSNP